MFQIHLKKDAFWVTSLRRLVHISKKMSIRDVSETSQKYLSQVFVIFQKHPTKMISCDFRRVIKMSDKIDVEPLEILKKWNVFWEQCIDIYEICHKYQWTDIAVRVLASQRDRQSIIVGVLFTTFSDLLTDKTFHNPLSLSEIQKSWRSLR